MSNGDNSSEDKTSILSTEIAIPYIVRFWIILSFYIPSLIFSLLVLYHFVVNRTLRQALHNRVITLLLFINLVVQLTHIPWILSYYRLGYVWLQTPSFCLTWMFIDEVLYITITLLFAWATFERHILIFHARLVSTKYRFIFFHCLPVIILLFYCICYSIITIIAPPCENTFKYAELVCGEPLCYYEVWSVKMWDVIVNDIIPTIIIIVCSVTLLLRVLYQKIRMHQPIRWRTHRKMTIQLLSISLLYLIIYIPIMLMEFLHLCGVPTDVGADFMSYIKFFKTYGNLLLPFVCAGSVPGLRKKIIKMLPCRMRQTRAVEPQTLTVLR